MNFNTAGLIVFHKWKFLLSSSSSLLRLQIPFFFVEQWDTSSGSHDLSVIIFHYDSQNPSLAPLTLLCSASSIQFLPVLSSFCPSSPEPLLLLPAVQLLLWVKPEPETGPEPIATRCCGGLQICFCSNQFHGWGMFFSPRGGTCLETLLKHPLDGWQSFFTVPS